MSRNRLNGGLITLCFLLSCRFGLAADPGTYTPAMPVTQPIGGQTSAIPPNAGPNDISNGNNNGSVLALPVTPAPSGSTTAPASVGYDASSSRKWYTITASLRETYDDNVNTTQVNPQASLETAISPSFLVDFPSVNGDFSARYTFSATYYGDLGSNSGGNVGGNAYSDSLDFDNEVNAQYTHAFSDRFHLNAAEDLRYQTDPNYFQSTGTVFRNGPYIVNQFSANLSAQWSPLIGTTTSYSNTWVNYFNTLIADTQNSIENTASQSVGFSVLPKISANLGGIFDNDTFFTAQRGYTSYTGYGGASWQALPSVSTSARGGVTYTQTEASNVAGFPPQPAQSQVSPYAALSLSWTLGAKSALTFDYSHEITPSDQQFSNGQQSDRASATFSYSITPSISAHLTGIYTHADVTQALVTTSAQPSYQEDDYGLDTGITYHYNSFLDFDFGVSTYGVSSGLPDRSYTRDEVTVGVRGTY